MLSKVTTPDDAVDVVIVSAVNDVAFKSITYFTSAFEVNVLNIKFSTIPSFNSTAPVCAVKLAFVNVSVLNFNVPDTKIAFAFSNVPFNVVFPDIFTLYAVVAAIFPSKYVLSRLITTFSFETVANTSLPVKFISFNVNVVAFDSSKPE